MIFPSCKRTHAQHNLMKAVPSYTTPAWAIFATTLQKTRQSRLWSGRICTVFSPSNLLDDNRPSVIQQNLSPRAHRISYSSFLDLSVMGRKVFADEFLVYEKARKSYLDGCVQHGLVVGTLSQPHPSSFAHAKDVVLDVIPTPDDTNFDPQWMFEHAVQVSRILPGGMHIIGAYKWAPSLIEPDQLAVLGNMVTKAEKYNGIHPVSAQNCGHTSGVTDGGVHEFLILYTDKSRDGSFRLVGRSAPVQGPFNSESMRPIELRFTSGLTYSMVPLVNNARISMNIQANSWQNLKTIFEDLLKDSVWVFDQGNFVSTPAMGESDQQDQSKVQTTVTQVLLRLQEEHEKNLIQVYLPFEKNSDLTLPSTSEPLLQVKGGIISLVALVDESVSFTQLVDALKTDAARSFRSRLELLEESDDEAKHPAAPELISGRSLSLPNRVVVYLRDGNNTERQRKTPVSKIRNKKLTVPFQASKGSFTTGRIFTDYLMGEEGKQDCVARCKELLGLSDVSLDNIQILEQKNEILFAEGETRESANKSIDKKNKEMRDNRAEDAKMASASVLLKTLDNNSDRQNSSFRNLMITGAFLSIILAVLIWVFTQQTKSN